MSTWSDHAIWWQLHPISFLDGEPSALDAAAPPVHRLGGLVAWLDYVVELGCNGLALGPIFASESHGYDTVDHYRIDSRLGTDQDFDDLVAACHQRGVKLLLDGVFNHVGRGFAAFQDVLTQRGSSGYLPWFRIDLEADGPDGFGYADFEGHHNLVALNHDEPKVQEYVAGVMSHWLARGADGWRLDAAYAMPLAFWRRVTELVRRDHPDAWLVGEVIHGDYSGFVQDGGLDSVTQYELWKAIWGGLNDRNFFELAHALGRHDEFAAEFRPLTFLGNHDVTRLASKLDDPRHVAAALAVLFTVAGTPSIYAGDEQGFQGVKYDRADGDAQVRPAFGATPAELAPYGWPTYRLHQDLIGLRRRHPWLIRAQSQVLHLANETLAYRCVDPDGGPGLAVLLNISDQEFSFPLEGLQVKRLLGSPETGAAEWVDAHGWAILEIQH
ncbi:MAG TPA: alpha-amylase family protein [Kineosporiaceae bacterium]|nr:alpha-amylase family protein [Kineosporiaceae bacterium]